MRLKDISLKFQALMRLRSFLKRDDDDDDDDDYEGVKLRGSKNVKKPSWMMPISHGHHIVDGRSWRGEDSELEQTDSVVVQREEMGNLELWFYGISDATIGDGISRYLQSNLFGKKFESLVRRKGKETMKKAYLNAIENLDSDNLEKIGNFGSVSAMVINGEKIVMAQIGGYKAIVCRDGMAHQLRPKHQHRGGKRHWPRRLISGAMRIPKVHIQACHSGIEPSRKQMNSSELIVVTDRIDSETEFIILASTGISEVMRNQEAVDLIRHIDDPQEAAECLTREALTRMSRSSISCLVIRFD